MTFKIPNNPLLKILNSYPHILNTISFPSTVCTPFSYSYYSFFRISRFFQYFKKLSYSKINSSMNFYTYIDHCNHCGNQDTEQFHHPRKLLLLSLCGQSHLASCPTSELFSITVVLSRSYKWHHTVCNHLRLVSLIQHATEIHQLLHRSTVCSLLIPLHVCTTVCLSIH